MEKLLDRIQVYWNKRAASYSEGLFTDEVIGRWRKALRDNLPKCRIRKVLDIGTGPGFFASVLSMEGYEVTAVDYSPGMLGRGLCPTLHQPIGIRIACLIGDGM